ncbi:Uncharacterised protein [Niallia circulans]|jgi:predicted RNA-binding Zn-ribbon protein involved in translation (DUF1610 family)|nr:Uncharacterised protein [Niallia circulans]
MGMDFFTVTCNKCKSQKVDVLPLEEKVIFECKDCGEIEMMIVR